MSQCAPMARPLALRLGVQSLAAPSFARRALSTTPTYRSDGTTTDASSGAAAPPSPHPSGPSNPWAAFASPSESARPEMPRVFERSPDTAIRPWAESRLLRQGTPPVGSRRRRVALRQHANIPFEQLPYQCFQEARAVLAELREKQIAALKKQLARIEYLRMAPLDVVGGSEGRRQVRIRDCENRANTLRIWIDINDPAVKRKFEDGKGDMNKPVYRYLAKKRWEKYNKLLINQRIKSFHIVPDFLPGLTPQADVQLYYRQKPVQPGTILPTLVTEHVPTLRVQVFEPGTRLATIVVVDGDVPDTENDSFYHRIHFAAVNVPIDPNNKNLALSRLPKENVVVPWLPAFAQKGSPYHRFGIFLMYQKNPDRVVAASIRSRFHGNRNLRDNFNLTSFNARYQLSPFGFTMFRTVWDDNTNAVMTRHKIPGADVEFKPMRIASLKPPVKVRGWEARRQGPKYRFLWKYTKRIRGLSTGKRWKGSKG